MPVGIYEKDDVDAIAKSIRNNLGNDTKYTVKQMPSAIDEIQVYAYNSGHSEGYGEGRNDGYTEGKADGVTEGIEQGKTEAYAEVEPINTQLENTLYGEDINTGGTVIDSLGQNVNQVNSDFVAIKDKIVENGVEVADGTRTADYASKVDEVYEAGRKSEYDEFWDNYQDYGNATDYTYAFSGRRWSQKLYEGVKYSFGQPTDVTGMFRYNNSITDTLQPLDCTRLKNLGQLFDGAINLKKIRPITVQPSNTFISTFYSCSSLEELEIVGTIGQDGLNLQWSTRLSKSSWVSIVGCYSSTISGLSMTGSLVSVNKAFETSEGANDGSTSAEWLNLIATKPNVTFNLV